MFYRPIVKWRRLSEVRTPNFMMSEFISPDILRQLLNQIISEKKVHHRRYLYARFSATSGKGVPEWKI